jgi:hypothetical protein
MRQTPTPRQILVSLALAVTMLASCRPQVAEYDPNKHPMDWHLLVPTLDRHSTQIGAGAVSGEALVQPVAFPHDRHVQKDGIECEYCHSAARNSIHAGVPELQTCMGCHERFVMQDSPEIQMMKEYWKRGEPVPWKKVHDLPDFVTFSHMRHVRAGVQCTECHGQVQTLAGHREAPKKNAQQADAAHAGEAPAAPEAPKGPFATAEEAAEALGPAVDTMRRESTLQMGWCLDCHASHPSITQNYCGPNSPADCEAASLRRAELKDCWTCHK